jgi:hypothetical protein
MCYVSIGHISKMETKNPYAAYASAVDLLVVTAIAAVGGVGAYMIVHSSLNNTGKSEQQTGEVADAGGESLFLACGKVADYATRRMEKDQRTQKSQLMTRLQTFIDSLAVSSKLRCDVESLLEQVGAYCAKNPPEGDVDKGPHLDIGVGGSDEGRASRAVAQYYRMTTSTAPTWQAAFRHFEKRASDMSVPTRTPAQPEDIPAADDGARCEDVGSDACDERHCVLLHNADGILPPKVCASPGQHAACWIAPPARPDAWESCDGAGGGPFDDAPHATGDVHDEAACSKRLQWWAERCSWKPDEGAFAFYKPEVTAVV